MRRVVVLTLVGCAGMSTAAAAQDEWYLETTVGAAWSATMDQQGHNSDHICYPTYVCSSSNGYRWSYNLAAERATSFGVAVGYAWQTVSVDVSASEHTANLTQEFRTITTLDGAPLEVLETSDYANSTLSMVGAFTKRSFAVNATYRIGSGALRPYVGVGIGVSMLKVGDLFFQSQYYCLQELCELADPSTYNARQTGDMTDTVLSQRVFVGVDRALRDGLLIGLRLIGGHAGSLEYEGLYDEHPVPNLTSTSEFGNINHLTLSLRLKYLLGV